MSWDGERFEAKEQVGKPPAHEAAEHGEVEVDKRRQDYANQPLFSE